MDQLIIHANGLASGLLSALLLWAVMNPRIRDGVVIKIGLVLMSLGFSATAWHLLAGLSCDDLLPINRARLLINAGAALVFVGYQLHLRAGHTLADLVKNGRRARRLPQAKTF